jgi:sensor c-di-GMP phosphodiesterase-like protein
MSNMSVQAPPQAPRKPATLSNALHVACALGAGLIPLTVFVVLSYYQTIRRAEADLTEIAELALQLARDILQEAELELTRFVNVSGGRLTPESERLLRAIIYTDPYFREARIIDERGLLIYSTVATIDLPIEIPADQRADPSDQPCRSSACTRLPSCVRSRSSSRCRPKGAVRWICWSIRPW